MLKKILCLFIILFFVVSLVPQAKAEIPNKINFQGRITQDGEPLTGTVNLTFQLRTTPAELAISPTFPWQRTIAVTPNSNGIFDVILEGGSPDLGTVDFSNTYYLHILNGSTWIGSQPLTTVPYAFHAKVADSLAGGSTSIWQTSGSNVYYNAGKVGIGTDSPSSTLQVESSADTGMSVTAPSLGVVGMSTGTSGGGVYGIGAKAGVIGGVNPLSFALLGGLPANNTVGVFGHGFHYGVYGLATESNAIAGVCGSSPGFGVIGKGVGDNVAATIGVMGMGNTVGVVGQGKGTGIGVAGSSENGPAAKFQVTGTGPGLIVTGGKVGIGTENPEYDLHIKNTSHTYLLFSNDTYTNGNLIGINHAGNYLIENREDGKGIYLRTKQGTGVYNRLMIQSDGKIGAGTTSPTASLHIKDNSVSDTPQLLIEEEGDDYARISFKNNNSPAYFTLAAKPESYYTSSIFNLYHSGVGKNLLTVKASGMVGIGTTNPDSTLHVVADSWDDDAMRVQVRKQLDNSETQTAFRVDKNRGAAVGTNDTSVPPRGMSVYGYTELGTGSQTPHQIKTYLLEGTFGSGYYGANYTSSTLAHKTIYAASLMVDTTAAGEDWISPSSATVSVRYSDGRISFNTGSSTYSGANYRVFVIYGPANGYYNLTSE